VAGGEARGQRHVGESATILSMATRSEWNIQKSEAVSTGAMITAEHPLAAEAGARILRDGGNAVDAAVAAAFAMGVVEPTTSGLGGVAWCVIREPDGTITTIDGAGAAPVRATPDMYELQSRGAAGMYGWPATKGDVQNVGYRSVGRMGAVGCLCHALERYGRMDRPSVMRDAIALAADGWETDWNLSLSLALYYDRLAPVDASRAIFFRASGAPLRAANLATRLSKCSVMRATRHGGWADVCARCSAGRCRRTSTKRNMGSGGSRRFPLSRISLSLSRASSQRVASTS